MKHRRRHVRQVRDDSPMDLLAELEAAHPVHRIHRVLSTSLDTTLEIATQELSSVGGALDGRISATVDGGRLAMGLQRLAVTEAARGIAAIRVVHEQIDGELYAKYLVPLCGSFDVATLDIAYDAIDNEITALRRSICDLVPKDIQSLTERVVDSATIEELVIQFPVEMQPNIGLALSLVRSMNAAAELLEAIDSARGGLQLIADRIKSVRTNYVYQIPLELVDAIEAAIQS